MSTINLSRKLYPLHEIRQIIVDELSIKKTIASKKAFMTREIKAHVNFLKDVTEAVCREHSKGWYLGDYYTAAHVLHYSKELLMLVEIREAL